MLRRLPPTITADEAPDWLPFGWLAHSTVLKRGRQTKTYTHLRTGKKLSTREHVLEYDEMFKVGEKRESEIHRRKANLKARETVSERPCWLPKLQIDSFFKNPFMMHVDTSNGLGTHSKEEVLLYQNTVELQSSSDEEEATGCNQITYIIEEDEEELSESEYVEVKGFSNIASTSLRSPPERLQKLESRAKTQCVFEDEDMSSDNEDKLPESKTSKEVKAQLVSNLAESLVKENLLDVVVERADKAKEIPGLTGSFSIEINLECEPASESLMEKDRNTNGKEGTKTRNIEIRDQGSDLVHLNASSKVVGVIQESGDKNKDPAKDLSNSIKLGLNTQEKSISRTKKRKKSTETCSSKNIKKKDTKAPTKKLRKCKALPSIQGGKNGPITEKKQDDWPELCPNFPFEPLTSSFKIQEDDSSIRRYLEQHFIAVRNADSNLPLPDLGLPSFSNIIISVDKEPEFKEKKSPDPPCVDVAVSSLPSCSSSMGTTTMQQTVLGNG